ncbi:MAG: hypothetical protein ACI4RC_05045 [Oscillospiraceae bacterium]
MKISGKAFYRVLPVISVLICIVCSAFAFVSLNNAEPKNPLNTKAKSSHMLVDDGRSIKVDENLLKEQNQMDINNGSDSSENGPESSLADESESSVVDVITDESSEEYIPVKNGQVTYYGDDKSDYANDNSIVEDDALSSSRAVLYDKESDSIVIKDKSVTDSHSGADISNSSQQPTNTETDKEYFKTTIKNGETLKTHNYSFEIIHKDKELRIVWQKIYLNGDLQPQFNGSVYLNEGKNTIRVAVKYSDKQGKIFSVYKDYELFVDLGNISISTDLESVTTDQKVIYFTAEAVFDGENVDISARLRGNNLEQENNRFKADLKFGKNIIVLSAQKGSHHAEKTVEITCTTQDELGIYTDLGDKTVYAENLTFRAYVTGGSENAYLTLNGRRITGQEHSIRLSIGRNSMRLKAVDGTKSAQFSCVITYVPETTAETAPIIKSINISDGMNIRGDDFVLNITAEDCEGNHLYSSNIQISLNGISCQRTWENSNYASYRIKFKNGVNDVNIRITDNSGRYADYSFRINCTSAAEGEEIGEITVSIDANVLGLGYIAAPVKVPVYQGENGAAVLDRFMKDNGISYTSNGSINSSFYLVKIIKTGIASTVNIPQQLKGYIENDRSVSWSSNKNADSLGEFDYTYSSGWMYSVNNLYGSSSLSDYIPKDGDVLKLRFTLASGKDIGGEGANYETIW